MTAVCAVLCELRAAACMRVASVLAHPVEVVVVVVVAVVGGAHSDGSPDRDAAQGAVLRRSA